MAAGQQTIDLAGLALSPGQGRRVELEVDPGEFELGGAPYSLASGHAGATLDVSRTAAGHALRLRFEARVEGPCMRCLDHARVEIGVDAREVDQPGSRDEELLSPYVVGGVLDLGGWAHDALVLALPQRLLCRPECPGLCPICGESLNQGDPGAHEHPPAPDPRWAKLREIQ